MKYSSKIFKVYHNKKGALKEINTPIERKIITRFGNVKVYLFAFFIEFVSIKNKLNKMRMS